MIVRSMIVPAFQAASTPIGTAMNTAMTRVTTISESVRLDALGDELGHRQAGEDGGAEVETGDLPDPFAEADEEGAVEAERAADLLHVLRRRLVAGDHRRRVAGSDVEQRKTKSATTAMTGIVARMRRTT